MLSTLLFVTVGPNSGDDIVIMMSGATRCVSTWPFKKATSRGSKNSPLPIAGETFKFTILL